MPVKLLTICLYVLALKFAPVEKARSYPSHPETHEQRRLRYASIATDIAKTVKADGPIRGLSEWQTATIILGLGIGESNLDPDADLGPQCYREGVYRSRCDGGLAVGIVQIQDKSITQRDRMFADRRLLLSRALKAIKGSFGACRKRPYLERLSAYASGSCTNEGGQRGSRKRLGLGLRLLVGR